MKRIIFWLGVLSTSLLQAQNVSVSYSNRFTLRDKGLTQKEGQSFRIGDYYFCVETDYKAMQLAYTARLKKVKYDVNIYKFDSTMKQTEKVAIDGQWSLGPFPPAPLYFSGKLLVFYYKVSENGDIHLLFSAVDPETMTVSAAKELNVFSEKNTGMFNIGKSFNLNTLSIAVNADSTKLLVVQSGNTDEFSSTVINKDLSFGKPVISRVRGDLDDFKINALCMDVAGNKYLTYDYIEDRKRQHGLIIQRATGKVEWPELRLPDDVTNAGLLWLRPSRDNSKVFVYGIAKGDMRMEREVGVLAATVDVAKLRLSKVDFFPYPQTLRQNLRKMDYAEKHHGNLEVKNAFYVSNELEDGTLVLTGYPEDIERVESMSTMNNAMNNAMTNAVTYVYAGPIINIFIKGGNANFGVIYRNQEMSNASMFIAAPYHNKLVCIYNDAEKSIATDDLRINGRKHDMKELVLAAAILNNDGTVISRKKVADKQGHLIFFTEDQKPLATERYLIPLGQDKANMFRYFTEYEEWATVSIQ
jgi:hypothetical protein